jgi:predicted dehydrogenase
MRVQPTLIACLNLLLDAACLRHILTNMNSLKSPSLQHSAKSGRPRAAETVTRRSFLSRFGVSAAALAMSTSSRAQDRPIAGLEPVAADPLASSAWKPVSDRKIRVGIAGYGLCKFGAAFGFQNHPNVELLAVSDLFPDRCAELARECRCTRTYPSLEKMVQDDRLEAIFVATDAPSHVQHCLEALKHGKHVASAVPAAFGSVDDAEKLFQAVKASGRRYMMFETSCFHEDLHAMRCLYKNGTLGKLVYSEGEYFHYMEEPLPSYKEWRVGLPPQWYPTHSNAYYVGVTGGTFTEVSCLGMPSRVAHLQPANNRYMNPFGTEVALLRTSEGGMSRMAVSWDTPGYGGEMGRVRGQKASFFDKYEGPSVNLANARRPPLPPGVPAGGHGGSHGYLMDEFVTAILQDRAPLVDIAMALNLTVPGIIAHQSALKDGEVMKIPQYRL